MWERRQEPFLKVNGGSKVGKLGKQVTMSRSRGAGRVGGGPWSNLVEIFREGNGEKVLMEGRAFQKQVGFTFGFDFYDWSLFIVSNLRHEICILQSEGITVTLMLGWGASC